MHPAPGKSGSKKGKGTKGAEQAISNLAHSALENGSVSGGDDGQRATELKKKISDACSGKARLTLEQKVEIIKLHTTTHAQKGESAAKLAERFGVQPRQIRRICTPTNAEKIRREVATGVDMTKRKMAREDKHPELTRELLQWIETMRLKFRDSNEFSQQISGRVIQARASEIAGRIGITDFKPSDGWLSRLNQKYGITLGRPVQEQDLETATRALDAVDHAFKRMRSNFPETTRAIAALRAAFLRERCEVLGKSKRTQNRTIVSDEQAREPAAL